MYYYSGSFFRHSRENGNLGFTHAENLLDTRWSLPQRDLSRGGYDDFEPIKIE
jgi:hypothetical protein